MNKHIFKIALLSIAMSIGFVACNSNTEEKPKDTGVKFNPTANKSDEISDAERKQKIAEKKAEFDAKQDINLMDNLVQFEGSVKLTVMLPEDNGLSIEENRLLESKMFQIVTANGIGGMGGNPRFIFTPIVNVLKKDVTSTAPVKYSIKYDVTLYVADMLTGNVYGTYNTQFLGVDESEARAFLSGFNNIKVTDANIQKFLKKSQDKIVEYYVNNGDKIIVEANGLATREKFSQAISLLESIPSEATEDISW